MELAQVERGMRRCAEDEATAIGPAIETLIASAPNSAFLERRLGTLDDPDRLLVFLHRFLVFNDALAARVPYLAGLIHLTPDLFVAADAPAGFLAQRNAWVAAFVARAASDEYRMAGGRNRIHQHLSQLFFRAALAFYGRDGAAEFERRHPVPAAVAALLAEARGMFFLAPTAQDIFAALGFHVGLEFFASEEFNLVDQCLRARHPALVAALRRGGQGRNDYSWLSLHTVVEVGHYRAGLAAVQAAIDLYADRPAAPRMAEAVLDGLDAFADLQRRFYATVLGEEP
jgi:hypothetical protein